MIDEISNVRTAKIHSQSHTRIRSCAGQKECSRVENCRSSADTGTPSRAREESESDHMELAVFLGTISIVHFADPCVVTIAGVIRRALVFGHPLMKKLLSFSEIERAVMAALALDSPANRCRRQAETAGTIVTSGAAPLPMSYGKQRPHWVRSPTGPARALSYKAPPDLIRRPGNDEFGAAGRRNKQMGANQTLSLSRTLL